MAHRSAEAPVSPQAIDSDVRAPTASPAVAVADVSALACGTAVWEAAAKTLAADAAQAARLGLRRSEK